jgi:hypothetical protein
LYITSRSQHYQHKNNTRKRTPPVRSRLPHPTRVSGNSRVATILRRLLGFPEAPQRRRNRGGRGTEGLRRLGFGGAAPSPARGQHKPLAPFGFSGYVPIQDRIEWIRSLHSIPINFQSYPGTIKTSKNCVRLDRNRLSGISVQQHSETRMRITIVQKYTQMNINFRVYAFNIHRTTP